MNTKTNVLSYQSGDIRSGSRTRRFAAHFAISFAVLFGLFLLTHGLLIFTVPNYKYMFHDRGIPIPSTMLILVRFADWYGDDWGWVFAFFLVPCLATLLAWRCRIIESPARIPRTLFGWLLAAVVLDILLILLGTITIRAALPNSRPPNASVLRLRDRISVYQRPQARQPHHIGKSQSCIHDHLDVKA